MSQQEGHCSLRKRETMPPNRKPDTVLILSLYVVATYKRAEPVAQCSALGVHYGTVQAGVGQWLYVYRPVYSIKLIEVSMRRYVSSVYVARSYPKTRERAIGVLHMLTLQIHAAWAILLQSQMHIHNIRPSIPHQSVHGPAAPADEHARDRCVPA